MTHSVEAAPVRFRFWSPSAKALCVLSFFGIAALLYRFLFGLEAATNLSDQYPWGIWKAVSVATAVAVATGGFTTAALVHVFHRRRYEVLLRPALLTGLVGYTFGVVSLGVDLGRYYNIWHPAWPTMWQGNSVLFEVAMCIMIYLTILYLEFLPILAERYSGRVAMPGPLRLLNGVAERLLTLSDRVLRRVMGALIAGGVVLSCMHHSSLGALMLVAPYKVHELWYTPVLPLLFLLSVFSTGFAALIAVAITTDWAIGRKPDIGTYSRLSRYVLVFQGIYLIARFSDVLVRDVHGYLLTPDALGLWWWLEVGVGGILPWIMLQSARLRNTPGPLLASCTLIVFGLLMNRVNVFLTAYQSAYNPVHYFPSPVELMVTIGLTAIFILLFRFMLMTFAIWPEAQVDEMRGEPSLVPEESRSHA